MRHLIPVASLLSLLSIAFSGCETSGQNALLGAATGAVIGGALHGRGDQALAGAAIGAAGGYLIGKVVQNDRERVYREGYYDGQGPQPLPEPHYPIGRPSGRYGFVVSPYYPYNRIDVRGIPRGARVLDPSCRQVFINP
ncbi:MAG: glycine zipper domain-containing protein [Verrucomicrobiota bacterium]